MSTIAALLLTFLIIIMGVNLANGTLTAWLKAKFLHIAPPTNSPAPPAIPAVAMPASATGALA